MAIVSKKEALKANGTLRKGYYFGKDGKPRKSATTTSTRKQKKKRRRRKKKGLLARIFG